MRLPTATNRCASRSLAGHAAREDRISSFVRQLPKIHPALPTGEVAPTRDSGRGAGDPLRAANLLRRRLLGFKGNLNPNSCLPRGIPAASLKHGADARAGRRVRVFRGNTRGLIEASASFGPVTASPASLPRGIPAASLKHGPASQSAGGAVGLSSAGNTRGLIEASKRSPIIHPFVSGLPRGIPAASLKRLLPDQRCLGRAGLPRGIPAASLKRGRARERQHIALVRLPRGIPAASLKQAQARRVIATPAGLPRGIPAASLKRKRVGWAYGRRGQSSAGNTRGLIEASAEPGGRGVGGESSAGNTRGLIEAEGYLAVWPLMAMSSAGNTRGLIEAGSTSTTTVAVPMVFRGEYPRPH